MAELEGRFATLNSIWSEERAQNSASATSQILIHRVSAMEETLRSMTANQAAILEHVRTARPTTPAQPSIRAQLAALIQSGALDGQ